MIWEALLLSYLLLLVGYTLYRYLLQSSLGLLQRKYSLLLIIGLAAGLPWVSSQFNHYVRIGEPASSYRAWNVVDIEDKQLLACYRNASNNADICACELRQQQQKVQWDYLPLQSFFLRSSWYALRVAAVIALLLFLRLLWGIYGLWRLSKQAGPGPYFFEGFAFYRIPQAQHWSVSAFSLGRHYILWGTNWQRCGAENRRAVLAHEVCHLQQGDAYWRMLWGFLHCFFFCHPIFYSLRSEFNLLCELLADKKAAQQMSSPKTYAQLLLHVQQRRANKEAPALCLALGQQHLRVRILYLLQNEQPAANKASFWRLATVIGLMLLTSCAASQVQSKDQPKHQVQPSSTVSDSWF